jgi:hypothetical protein
VDDVTFNAMTPTPCCDAMFDACYGNDGHEDEPLFQWMLRVILDINLHTPAWQHLAEAWKWLKEGRYRPRP